MNTVIETHGLTRKFGDQVAVDALDMHVGKGEIYGFLGLNGAGKTTTIRMLMGLSRATAGRMAILGHEVPRRRTEVMGRVGALVESPSYYAHLTGRENLKVLAVLLGVSDTRIAEVLRQVGLADAAEKKAGQYSLGMKQRLGLAAALLGEPELLVLDEPTNGLDPAGIQEMRNLIVQLPREHGITVLVSSHLLSEVDQMATHVGVVHHGRMLFQGPIENLRARSSASVVIECDRPAEAHRDLLRAEIPARHDAGQLALASFEPAVAAHAVRELVLAGHSVFRVSERRPTLEDIFLELTAESPVGGPVPAQVRAPRVLRGSDAA
jgi:ABC-2 type transport system ATP-binding protein